MPTSAAAVEHAIEPVAEVEAEPKRVARKTAAVAQVPKQQKNPAAAIYGSISSAIKKPK
jgi:hypothetical protein